MILRTVVRKVETVVAREKECMYCKPDKTPIVTKGTMKPVSKSVWEWIKAEALEIERNNGYVDTCFKSNAIK